MPDLLNEYFARKPKEEIGDLLKSKINEYLASVDEYGIYERWLISYREYYAVEFLELGFNIGIRPGGKRGEIQNMKINDYRNNIQHVLNLVTNNRPALDARAINNDEKSQKQAILGTQLLDYYIREKRLERLLKSAVEKSLVYGEGFILLDWNSKLGEDFEVNPDNNKVEKTGDIEFSVHNPLDIIRDGQVREPDGHQWYIVRRYKNKYDLAAQYSKYKEQIINSDTKDTDDFRTWLFYENNIKTDQTAYYTFYHAKTESVPEGRLVKFMSDGTVIYDGELPFEEIPLYRVTPAHQEQSTFGYTPAFDLLGIQEGIDRLYSTVMTNQSAFGVQSIVIDKGSDVSAKDLAGGLRLIKKNKDFSIQPLQLTSTPPEVFNFLALLEKKGETLMGINSVIRGQPDASLREASGAALALLADQAIKYNSGLQQSWIQLLEDVGSGIIGTLQNFASVPRMAQIAGKNGEQYLKEFSADDVDLIDRVIVDVGNPLANTTSGRLKIADQFLQYGSINPKQYWEILKTGNLDVGFKDIEREELLIEHENEALVEGNPVAVTALDDHAQHIIEHRGILSDPDRRFNPEIVQAVLAHVNEHLAELREADQGLLQITGQPAIGPLPPNPEEVGVPGVVEPDGVNAAREGAVGDPIGLSGGQEINQPTLPTNPLTGEQSSGELSLPV